MEGGGKGGQRDHRWQAVCGGGCNRQRVVREWRGASHACSRVYVVRVRVVRNASGSNVGNPKTHRGRAE